MKEIIDLAGNQVIVEDLEAAIRQTDLFRNLYHDEAGFEKLDQRLNAYWEDFYQKLIVLR
jgi:hypothetical protein